MKMATYPNRNPSVSVADKEAFNPNFTWIHPGSFSCATRAGSNPFQPSQMNRNPSIAAIPLRSVPPSAEPEPNYETLPTKIKKKKPSSKSPCKDPSEALRPKQPKKKPSASKKGKAQFQPGVNVERKNLNTEFAKLNLDLSRVPHPFCSCTGAPRGCYKGGSGGWQSSCCNTKVSEYPLPMTPSKPGVRVAGRKMSNGAYRNLLCRLAAEGYDLSRPVDLKDHWAKHGTNKFVTLK